MHMPRAPKITTVANMILLQHLEKMRQAFAAAEIPLALARLSAPRPTPAFSQNIDDTSIARLRQLRLGSLAWWNCRDESSPWRTCLNERQVAELKTCFVARTAASLHAHAAAQVAIAAFSHTPAIPHIFIKGFAASAALYPHPALRPLGDVDLWVDPARFAEAIERLRAKGYSGEPALGADNVVQLRHPALPSIDLHSALRQSVRLNFPFAQAYARRQLLQVDHLGVSIPGLIDLFIVQAYSLASGELVESFNAWVDLRELLLLHPALLNNNELWRRVDQSGLRAAIWAVLLRLDQMWPELKNFQEPPASQTARQQIPLAQSLGLKALLPTIDEILSGQRLPRWRQLAVKALFLDNKKRAARFLAAYAQIRLNDWRGAKQKKAS